MLLFFVSCEVYYLQAEPMVQSVELGFNINP